LNRLLLGKGLVRPSHPNRLRVVFSRRMALVPCPECKAQVSRAAKSCPQCGFPLGEVAVASTPFQVTTAPADERILWEGAPSFRALAVTIAATALFAIALPLAVYFAYPLVHDLVVHLSESSAKLVAEYEGHARTAIILLVIALVAVRIGRLAGRMLALRSHHYSVSNQRIKVESGVFSKMLAEVDVRTIDDILFHQTFFERLLGVGQIALVSSEPSNPRLTLIGVTNPREVRELIRNSAYQATRGQLFTRST
jgi:hypothetical protein